MTDDKRWLWVTAEVTDDLVTGGLVYSHELVRAVARAGVDVTLVGLGRTAAAVYRTSAGPLAAESLDVVAVPGSIRGGLRSVPSRLPNLAYGCSSRALEDRVRELLCETWDVVVVDNLRAAWVAPLLARRPPAHVRAVVFVTQNHEASLRADSARQIPWWNPRRWLLSFDAFKAGRLERAMLEASDVVTSITEDDRVLFEADAPGKRHLVLAPGWSGDKPEVVTPIGERPRRAVIVGSFDWHLKQENLRRFVAAADAEFAAAGVELVVGGRMPEQFRASLDVGLRATRFEGWVDDLAEFVGAARLGVLSEPLGGGFKMKSLDYVFSGVAIAALDDCVRGLPLVDGTSMISAADEASLVARIVEMIDEGAVLEQYVAISQQECSRIFSWTASASSLVAVVE